MSPFVRPSDENGPVITHLSHRERWTPTTRGWCLLVLGLTCIGRGVAFISSGRDVPGLSLLSLYATMPILGSIWIAFGMACVTSLALRRWKLMFAISTGLHLLWAVSYMIADLALPGDYWGSALLFVQLAMFSYAVGAMLDAPHLK